MFTMRPEVFTALLSDHAATGGARPGRSGLRLKNIQSAMLIGLLALAGGCAMANNGKNLHGRERANYLVREIGRRMGVKDAQLDGDDDR